MRVPLIVRLIIAIVLGVGFGGFAPEWGVRSVNCFGSTFGQFIKFIVPFIILAFVTPAIADTGRHAGRMLLLTMAIAWVSTVTFGYFAYGVSCAVLPQWMSGGAGLASDVHVHAPYFTLQIPPLMDVFTALVTAFVIGFGIVATGSETMRKVVNDLNAIVTVTLQKAFVPFLPVYAFSVMADLAASGKLAAVGSACWKIMLLASVTSVLVLVLQFTIAGIIARKNPIRALVTMLPAYLTGLGCCSSAATIPYTLAQTKKNGVSEETAALVIPLCSNVHMAGSMSNMVIYAAGLMALSGEALGFGGFTEYILMISIIAIASPGVPGGIVLASSAVAETALGFTPERYAIMIAIYMALDGMGTACNLTGDGAIALIVDKFRSKVKG